MHFNKSKSNSVFSHYEMYVTVKQVDKQIINRKRHRESGLKEVQNVFNFLP